MNYIKHLTGFFDRVTNDKLLNPTHVSLYIALFQFWNCNRFRNPISISRDEVMRISKISSKATYHKCLKALHANGYIKYEPSYNPFKGSHVFLFNFADDLKPLTKAERANPIFEPTGEQVPAKSKPANGTTLKPVHEQALVPSINNTNNTNIQNFSNDSNLREPEYNDDDSDLDSEIEQANPKEKKLRQKKKSGSDEPSLQRIQEYFAEQHFPEQEAKKFYNYFQSIGWLVGGKIPMADWQAAARNWMLNASKYNSHEPTDATRTFDTSAGKNYSEPL